MIGDEFRGHDTKDGSDIPVGLATTALLDFLGILASVTVLGEEAREVFLRSGSAVSQTGVVLVVVLEAVI